MDGSHRGLHRFLATAHRMNVIERWNNKPNLLPETVAAHSFLVAVIGWGLAASAQSRGEPIELVEVLKRALAHDLHEVITGDILAPTKRAARILQRAVDQLERRAGRELIRLLPDGLRERIEPYVIAPMDGSPEARYVKTADLLAASLKAWLEVQLGNQFHRGNLNRIRRLLKDLPIEEVQNMLWELEIYADTLEGEPSLGAFLRYLFTLYYVKRWNNLPSLTPKSVAAHSHLVAFIAWVLAEAENLWFGGRLPIYDVICRALLLEAPKAVTGDILYHSKTATKTMARGVEIARTKAARELVATLPAALQPVFGPYLEPLDDQAAEQLVDDAGLIAGYLEAAMEVRLGNTYFRPILENLRRRVDSPYRSTRQVLAALEDDPDAELET